MTESKKVLRESVADAVIGELCEAMLRKTSKLPSIKTSGGGVAVNAWPIWSEWTLGLQPVADRKTQFFKRASAIGAVPIAGGGVYEIGAMLPGTTDRLVMAQQMIIVYCGKATKVRKDSQGVTLRKRIYSGYCCKGSHLAQPLRTALEIGANIWFRWILLPRVGACTSMEEMLLGHFDYDLNVQLNGGTKKLVGQRMMRHLVEKKAATDVVPMTAAAALSIMSTDERELARRIHAMPARSRQLLMQAFRADWVV